MIEYVEGDVYEITDSDFSKATAIFYQIDHGKDGVRPSLKLVDLMETLGEGFHGEELAGHLQKVDPTESGSLDRFYFVGWYVDKEVSLESAEEADRLVGWACKVSLVDL